MTVMGIRYCDFANLKPPTPFQEQGFNATCKTWVALENGHFELLDAETLATQDPDHEYFLVKNPDPRFSQANHYLVISNRVSIAAFPKPQLARDWAKNIGNAQ